MPEPSVRPAAVDGMQALLRRTRAATGVVTGTPDITGGGSVGASPSAFGGGSGSGS